MVAFGETVRDTLQNKPTAQLLMTFKIKDPYNGPIPQPRDCNKANGAKESGGGGGGEKAEGEEEETALRPLPCPIFSVTRTRTHTHTHTHTCDVSSALNTSYPHCSAPLSFLYNPLLSDSIMPSALGRKK